MASAASLIPELKTGKTLTRPGSDSVTDSLWMDKEKVTYGKYFGEGEWSYQTFTLEDIAAWTDDGDWEVEEA